MKSPSELESSELNSDVVGDVQKDASNVCPTRLIDDSPAQDDLLAPHGEIGPHERVARAISELVLSPQESGGKMIGLEGGWGVGKTTVINLLRGQLLGNNDITLVSFDAWAHEGDPLRRTYLESLIRHFQRVRWVDKTEWDKTLEKLANRRRITTTRTVPKTTNLGKALFLSAFLVPLGVPFLTKSLENGITKDPYMFVVGILLTAAPFIVLGFNLILVLRKLLRRWKNGGESSGESKDDDQELSDWALLTGNAITETRQDTIETPEPTSIEFEDNFRKLMRAALPENANRQAVLVLDNLDRVDPKDAQSIWATLQTFLQYRSTNTETWFNKLWIIVPYDPAGLRQLWANRGVDDESAGKDRSSPTGGHNEADYVLATSFMDKSFQLRFEVPPPVLSNWKAYLTKLVAEALPKHSNEEDQRAIYSVFNLSRANEGEAPTPRELKLYVNQIGAIHRQWQDEFPIGHVAYYVILRRRHDSIPGCLLNGKFRDSRIESILPPNLVASLAGLAFNVRASLGQQLLLSNPIHGALANNDAEALKTLEVGHQDGFWAVLEQVVTSWPDTMDATTVANAALCIDRSGILEVRERSETRAVMRGLGKAACRVQTWSPFDERLASGIATTCRLVSDPSVSATVVATLRRTIMPKKKEEAPAVTEGVVSGLVSICEQISGLGHEDALDSPFVLSVDAQGWGKVCSILKTQNSKNWSLFKPEAEFDQISQFLCEAVTSGQYSDEHLVAVQVTNVSSPECSWDPLAQEFGQRLNTAQNPNVQEVNLLLAGLSLLRLYGCASAQVETKRLADEGHLMHCLHQAQQLNHDECMARCITVFLENRPEAPKPPSVGSSDAGYATLMDLLNTDNADLAKRIVTILSDSNHLDLLFTVVDQRGQYDPLIVRCLRIVADSKTPENLYAPDAVIRRWQDLRKYLVEGEHGDRFDRLIGHLCEKSSLLREVQEAEGGFSPKDAGLYLAICQASSLEPFRVWCRVGVETLDAEQWKSELFGEGDALNLMLTLMKAGTSVTLKTDYQDALVDHAKGVLTGSIKPSSDLVSRASEVFAALGTPAARKILRDRFRNAAMDQDGECADSFFEMYGSEIMDHVTLAETNIVAKLFSPLVRKHRTGGLRWLRDVFSKNPKILEECDDKAAVQDFCQRLQGELGKSADDDEGHKLIAEIANLLGIEPEEEPPEDEAASNGNTPEDDGSEEENSNAE